MAGKEVISKMQLVPSSAPYVLYSWETFLKAQKNQGNRLIEVWGSAPHLYVDSHGVAGTAALKQGLESYGMQPVFYCPRPYQYTLCAEAGTLLWQASVDYYKYSIQAARELGITLVSVAAVGGNQDKEKEQLFIQISEALEPLLKEAESQGVSLCLRSIHNNEGMVGRSLLEVQKLKQRHKSLKIQMDILSIIMAGERVCDWLEAFRDHVVYIRFSDGCSQGERVAGMGCFPLRTILKELSVWNYDGFLGLRMTDESVCLNAEKKDRENQFYIKQLLKEGDGEN